MVSADRQLIMESNRSLRNIKTELESLLGKGVIAESVFDEIMVALPQESPLSEPLRTAASSSDTAPAAAPTEQRQNLGLTSAEVASVPAPTGPPSYDATPAPQVPSRSDRPVIARARALYRYVVSDERDLSFEKDDNIVVYECMNQDWWMGQNARTQREGIFPRNYVLVEEDKSNAMGVPAQQQPPYGYLPVGRGPPPQQTPYNASVPPMAIAEGQGQGQGQQGEGSKVNQYGKKLGKKLGNAAIFGAGATIGGNIVNSIF